MPVCNKCGGPIEFRHIDGQPTLIHLDGGCCEGVRPAKNVPHRGAYSSPEAYVNPNAKCPVCGKMVFYFQNRFGSRVFFDDLGWPWPKHPCTDNPLSQKGKIKRVKNRAKRTPKVRLGAFSIYKLIPIDDADGTVTLKFRKVGSPLIVSTFRTSAEALATLGLHIEDLREAPSFVMRRGPNETAMEFISARRAMIGSLVFPRI